jgi:UDP-glucose 4-epimerase
MRILFTGASSFSGFTFVRNLAAVGHELICPLLRPIEQYEGVRRQRVELLHAPVSPSSTRPPLFTTAPFGSDPFLKLIRDNAPIDLLCHHAADATNYKSLDFDTLRALENNTRNLSNVLAAFKQSGGKAVLLTGTVFEMDEGTAHSAPHTPHSAFNESLPAFSPYGLSKGLTWQIFRHYCQASDIPLGKFVIPNPFGPWEEPRFTAYLLNTWKQGKVAQVQTPDYLRDNIHVDLLAAAYVQFARQVASHYGPAIKLNPSGYVETQGAFAQRVAREVRARSQWPCGLELLVQKDFPEPRARANSQPATALVRDWNESAAWDAFVNFYRES